jgi:cytochrome c oxidase subunit III
LLFYLKPRLSGEVILVVAMTSSEMAAEPRGKLGMWIFLGADALSFAALLIAYGVLRARAGEWPDMAARLNLPLGAVLTYVLLASSTTMALATGAARDGRARAATRWLWATIALGTLFVAGQALEWRTLVGRGIGIALDQAASTYYVCTGWHGAHVLAGLAILLSCTRASTDAGRLAVAALFWHFVDAVWILVFTFVYLA